jgi:glutamate racemase
MMKQLDRKQAIGVFDSGVGGLTVAHALKQILPEEQLIYFGDTAHLPYGDKSGETIIRYSKEIGEFLLNKGCKVILMACNSASAAAYEEMDSQFGNRGRVVNVIDPVVNYLKDQCNSGKIGVIGTKATIHSGTYETRIKKQCPDLEVASMATPLFVPMIEEGFIFDNISNAIIKTYLSNKQISGIKSLILGCTHYPIIKNQINKYYNFEVEIIDSAKIVAQELKRLLSEMDLLNVKSNQTDEFFVSDYTEHFSKIAKMFFEEKINLQRISLKDS